MSMSYKKSNYLKTKEKLLISFIFVGTNVNSFYSTLDFRRSAKCKQKVYCTITDA